MDKKEFAEKMGELGDGCEECDHIEADRLMCEVLKELGYGDGVKLFEELHKWYA